MVFVNSLEVVRFAVKLGDTLMTLALFYTGLLVVEGDEHKHQVRFCFKICSRTIV